MKTTPASVLVIERHPLMREAFCSAINDEADLTVSGQAANCMEAFSNWGLSKQANPDIILFALGNPEQDELETITSVRKLLPETAILALTNNEIEGQKQAALNAGAHMALSKSEPRKALIEALRSLRSFQVDSQKQDFETNLNQYLSGLEHA
jgi:DNA-binding NarL/FixJ family response regulator